MDFNSLGISGRLLEAVATAGYVEPTSVQEKVIPHVLQGRDILASAQTGSGKTAAFILPLVDMLGSKRAGKRMPRALILEPTRELAAQVQEVMTNLGCNHDLESSLLIGGVSFKNQRDELKNSPDVLIATPGRLLDHIERGTVLLNEIALLVIDEADRMLDMGFLPDVRRILSFLPPRRQSLLFSATLPDDILALSKNFMNDVKMVKASPMSSASQDVKHYLKMVDKRDKGDVMVDLVRSVSPVIERSIIFCNRKRDISSLVTKLRYDLKETSLTVAGLHGDMDQSARTRTLNGFRKGDIRLLVASDVAARGIDVEDVTHVFLNDVPISAEDYIHRSGRTEIGRAHV